MARNRRKPAGASSDKPTPTAAEGDPALALHMTFRISPELRERLSAAAGGRPIGEEIRRRLEASFSPEQSAIDPKTRKLVGDIADVARTLEGFDVPWHESPYSFVALRAAVETFRTAHGPNGDPVFEPRHKALFDPAVPPDAAGRMLAAWHLGSKGKGKGQP